MAELTLGTSVRTASALDVANASVAEGGAESAARFPDSVISVGRTKIVAMCNGIILLYDRSMTQLAAMTQRTFFGLGGQTFNARVIFHQELFWITACHGTRFALAISKSANPASLTTSDWTLSSLLLGGSVDLPVLSPHADGAILHPNVPFTDVYAVDSDLNCTAVDKPADVEFPGFAPQAYDASSGKTWFIKRSALTQLSLWSLSDPFGTPVWSSAYTLNVDSFASGDVLQPGSVVFDEAPIGSTIPCIAGQRMVWAYHLGGSVRWWEINLSTGTPVIANSGSIGSGDSCNPGVGINDNGDIVITYLKMSVSEYPTIYVTGRGRSDAANTMRTPQLVKASLVNRRGASHPSGDVATVVADPENQTLWTCNEYYIEPNANDSNWESWATRVTVENRYYGSWNYSRS